MWSQTFSKTYPGVTRTKIWKVWSDVKNWPIWDSALEYCQIDQPFQEGSHFILKPKGGPKVRIFIDTLEHEKVFIDHCRFLGATMRDLHYLEDTPQGVKITQRIEVEGPLSFLWVRLVAKGVAAEIPIQTDFMIEYAKGLS